MLAKSRESYFKDNKEFILEESITADVSLIKAWKSDKQGNLIYRKSARNFNQDMAKAGKYVVAEVEEIVADGQIPAEDVHTPSIFVGMLISI